MLGDVAAQVLLLQSRDWIWKPAPRIRFVSHKNYAQDNIRWQCILTKTSTITAKMHDINVTPFIDVMLVLLIIFMVAAPLATVDVKVNLPASTSTPQPRPEKPVYLSVKADNSMFIGNDPVTDETMITALNALTEGKERHHHLLPSG